MELWTIALLIIMGLILLLIEFLIIPGISVAGIAGFVCIIGGIFLAFYFRGSKIGAITLASTVFISIITIFTAFKYKTWQKLGMEATIDSKIITLNKGEINPGDNGITISRLNPIGKALIKEKFYEAKSIAGFIDENKEIVVIKIQNNQVIVKLKT